MSDDDEVKLEGRGWRCFVSPWCIYPIWFAFASVYMTHSQQSLHIEIDSLLPSSPQTRILYDHPLTTPQTCKTHSTTTITALILLRIISIGILHPTMRIPSPKTSMPKFIRVGGHGTCGVRYSSSPAGSLSSSFETISCLSAIASTQIHLNIK
jgi:hypothetical protein